jgi:hypothetical protein
MIDRTAELEAAVRAQDKLIAEAQRLLKAYVETKRVHPDAVSARRSVWCAMRWARTSATTHEEQSIAR